MKPHPKLAEAMVMIKVGTRLLKNVMTPRKEEWEDVTAECEFHPSIHPWYYGRLIHIRENVSFDVMRYPEQYRLTKADVLLMGNHTVQNFFRVERKNTP